MNKKIKNMVENNSPLKGYLTLTEGTFTSKDQVASYQSREGDYAEVYNKGGKYYAVVSGGVDYDMEANSKQEMLKKLKRDGLTQLVSGAL